MILRQVLQSPGCFHLSELCILCYAHPTSWVARITSARPDTGIQLCFQILDRLRQDIGTQSFWNLDLWGKTGELPASQRAKQTQRRTLGASWIPLLRAQCWQSKWYCWCLTALYFFFLEILGKLGCKERGLICAYAYQITMHRNLLNIHFTFVCMCWIHVYAYTHVVCVHIYISMYIHE